MHCKILQLKLDLWLLCKTFFNSCGWAIKESRAPAGSARNAASVGAKSVNGPAINEGIDLLESSETRFET